MSPIASDNIASVGFEPINPGMLVTPATPTPFPSSQPPPEQVGPTAVPSSFSPQCPIGETYTLPLPSPQATASQAPPFPPYPPGMPGYNPAPYPAPVISTPPPPGSMRYTFTLPLDISQQRFCGTGSPRHWFIDTAHVLNYQIGNQPPQRIQLSKPQTDDMLELLNTTQPQQWAFTPMAYRCQAAELCPLEQSIRVGRENGGETGWNDRGNLAYPEDYTQAMTQLIEKIEKARQNSPTASSRQSYQPALTFRHFDAEAQVTGSSYVLLSDGTLRAYEERVQLKEIRLSPEQQTDFQERLQGLAPMETYARLVDDVDAPRDLANETLWVFEYVRIERISGPHGGSIALSTLPNTPEGNALKAGLDALVDQLKAYLSESTP